MKNLFKAISIPVLLAASSLSSASGIAIDLFSGGTPEAPIAQFAADYTDGGAAVDALEAGPYPDIVGGYRDLSVNCLTGCIDNGGGGPGSLGTEAVVGYSALLGRNVFAMSNDAQVTGEATLIWDGQGSTGLGGFDLSGFSAFEVDVFLSDSGDDAAWKFQLIAADGSGRNSVVQLVAATVPLVVGSSQLFYIDISLFNQCGLVNVICSGGDADIVDLSDLELLGVVFNFEGAVAVDLGLHGIRAVPEPAMVSMMGLGLLLMGFFARRKSLEA
ncbi:PEP-CTERM sorting domain-containing protein [Aestuariicella sp. G3-2]|uniref:PEP-CTERM sorting domain-containing protein n=1 Tax=Pseudomaricurvus albidus TaxID=2842452 RepID=UPI001C0DBB3E|nr:PEP-CTERM sorting domain-containing protein [Aestuariicella albida]MBU3070855.1 PEP-CTERM sorting domain-containing protein [Aestuariicella albida]